MSCWATNHIKNLTEGVCITIRPKGNSMLPLIKSGQEVTIQPTGGWMADHGRTRLPENAIVLCKVKGKHFLHKIKSTSLSSSLADVRYMIANNKGKENGWIGINAIYGVVTHIEGKKYNV